MLVLGATVVPGTVDADLVVAGWTVLSPDTLGAMVSSGTTDGSTVVPGKVVVIVATWPRAVAAIAVPEPLAVYWVGIGKAAVSGLEGESSDP